MCGVKKDIGGPHRPHDAHDAGCCGAINPNHTLKICASYPVFATLHDKHAKLLQALPRPNHGPNPINCACCMVFGCVLNMFPALLRLLSYDFWTALASQIRYNVASDLQKRYTGG